MRSLSIDILIYICYIAGDYVLTKEIAMESVCQEHVPRSPPGGRPWLAAAGEGKNVKRVIQKVVFRVELSGARLLVEARKECRNWELGREASFNTDGQLISEALAVLNLPLMDLAVTEEYPAWIRGPQSGGAGFLSIWSILQEVDRA